MRRTDSQLIIDSPALRSVLIRLLLLSSATILLYGCATKLPLQHESQMPAGRVLPIDGLWQNSATKVVFKVDRGRIYFDSAFNSNVVDRGMVAYRNVSPTGPTEYNCETSVTYAGAQYWAACIIRLTRDGTLTILSDPKKEVRYSGDVNRFSTVALQDPVAYYAAFSDPEQMTTGSALQIDSAPSTASNSLESKAGLDFIPYVDSGDLEFGRYFALVIGNADYQHLPRLETPIRDADSVADMLRGDYGFDVQLLRNASRNQLVAALSRYRRMLGRQDNLLIYYAGHGWNDELAGEAYWLPVDAEEADFTNWISNSTITAALRATEAKHILVVADSCYSGTLTRGLHVKQRNPGYLQRIASLRARMALTSGGNEPVIDNGRNGHSVFANAFLAALKSNTGIMDGTQLFQAVRRPVVLQADQTPTYGDIRKAGHQEGDFLFVRETPSD